MTLLLWGSRSRTAIRYGNIHRTITRLSETVVRPNLTEQLSLQRLNSMPVQGERQKIMVTGPNNRNMEDTCSISEEFAMGDDYPIPPDCGHIRPGNGLKGQPLWNQSLGHARAQINSKQHFIARLLALDLKLRSPEEYREGWYRGIREFLVEI